MKSIFKPLSLLINTLVLSLVFSSISVAYENSTLSELSKTLINAADVTQVTLSPDGKHVAILRKAEASKELLIINSQSKKAMNQILFPKDNQVNEFIWANNERIVLTLASSYNRKYVRKNRSEFDKRINKKRSFKINKAYSNQNIQRFTDLYAVNIDQAEGEFIFGRRFIQPKGKSIDSVSREKRFTHERKPHFLSAYLDDKDHILINTYRGSNTYFYKLNVNTAQLEQFTELDYRPENLYFDEASQTLYVSKRNKSRESIFKLAINQTEWQLVTKDASSELAIIGTNNQTKNILVKDYCGNNTVSICEINNNQLKPIYNNKTYSVSSVIQSADGSALGFSFMGEYPQFEFIDQLDKSSTVKAAQIYQQFKGLNTQVNWSPNAEVALIKVNGDVNPNTWYLYNEKSENKLSFLIASYNQLNNKNLSPTYSFKFNTIDEVTLQGYVTLPANKQKNAPAVVIANDNIYNGRHNWQFEPITQLLVSQGYAVVKINHRGSVGFGEAFKKLGRPIHKQSLQQDIIDSIDYLQTNNIIDPKKVCIMGKDNGGQQALKTAMLAPKKFQCVISDSAYFQHSKDPSKNRFSLVDKIDSLKTPILVLYGKKGKAQRAFEQASFLIEVLNKKSKAYKHWERPADDFFLTQTENRQKHYQMIIEFLAQHIQ